MGVASHMLHAPHIIAFLTRNPVAIVAELTSVRGSSPRAQGTFMLIGPRDFIGTIGGGALEHLVIERARQVIRDGIGATISTCRSGRRSANAAAGGSMSRCGSSPRPRRRSWIARARREEAAQPAVLVFGAGHVGQALARALALLPVKVTIIDTRADELVGLPPNVIPKVTAIPEASVRQAPDGSAYVILTHDHALDFLIAQEALARADSPYVGMIGSRTKKAKFAHWFKAEGGDPQLLNRLVMPIGKQGLGDKRPEVIAALAAAEIMVHIGRREVEEMCVRPVTGEVDTVNGR